MKSALVVWGGWEGHEPKQCVDVITPWLKSKGFKVTVSNTLDAYLNKRKMKNYSVIIPVWTGWDGKVEKGELKALSEAVKNGVGLAGWHGGMCDSFRGDTDYQFMTGGQWVAHPGGIIRYSVNISEPNDPIVRDLKDFRMHSEQYYMHTDPGNEVVATTKISGRHGGISWVKDTVMPVVWKRRWGKGRVFFSSLVHVAKDFEVPEALEIMKRGILWAAKERIAPEYKS